MKKIKNLELSPRQLMTEEERKQVRGGGNIFDPVLVKHSDVCTCTYEGDCHRETFLYQLTNVKFHFDGKVLTQYFSYTYMGSYRDNMCTKYFGLHSSLNKHEVGEMRPLMTTLII